MTDEGHEVLAGYELRDLYASEQEQEVVTDKEEIPESEEDREITFSWDWRIPNLPEDLDVDQEAAEGRGVWFDVTIGAQVGPAPEDPNRYNANLVGGFVGALANQSVPIHRFAKFNAVALLYPYLRQCIGDLSDWSSDGTYFLPIVNVAGLMEGLPLERTQGWEDLRAHPRLAERLGVPSEELAKAQE